MLILRQRGPVTAAQLAEELEVSTRTVRRDIEELSGAGVPVYATRGPGGGFHLLDTFTDDIPIPSGRHPRSRAGSSSKRATVRISDQGRQLAVLLGRLPPLRVRLAAGVDPEGWREATFALESVDATTVDLLALSPHVEVLEPLDLRRAVEARLLRAAALYR